jgi:hypothetical protein
MFGCVCVQCGGVAGAQMHVARTVCRRAERAVIGLEDGTVPPVVGRFLNRYGVRAATGPACVFTLALLSCCPG